MTSAKAPVVFIHGLWLHASSWQPWQELFAEAGYESSAPGWPGDADTVEATRANPDAVANHGIDEVTNQYASFIDGLPARPILIGHSFGGLIAEKLLGMDYGTAAIGIDAAQIKGVLQLPLSQLRGTLSIFANPANRHRAVSLTAGEFRYSFGNALTEEESDALHERGTGSPTARAGCWIPPQSGRCRSCSGTPWRSVRRPCACWSGWRKSTATLATGTAAVGGRP